MIFSSLPFNKHRKSLVKQKYVGLKILVITNKQDMFVWMFYLNESIGHWQDEKDRQWKNIFLSSTIQLTLNHLPIYDFFILRTSRRILCFIAFHPVTNPYPRKVLRTQWSSSSDSRNRNDNNNNKNNNNIAPFY
jgi:hypothetical protein